MFQKNISKINDLELISQELVKEFKAPQIILLEGDLGSGKSQTVRFMCLALGVSYKEIQSPSFSFINKYKSSRSFVYHVDLFRLKEGDDLDLKGFWDIFHEPCEALFIEWSDRLREPLPPWSTLSLSFKSSDETRLLKGRWS